MSLAIPSKVQTIPFPIAPNAVLRNKCNQSTRLVYGNYETQLRETKDNPREWKVAHSQEFEQLLLVRQRLPAPLHPLAVCRFDAASNNG